MRIGHELRQQLRVIALQLKIFLSGCVFVGGLEGGSTFTIARLGHLCILSSSAYVSKYLVVKYDHYDRGYVEREHGRVDEKRFVIEAAVVRLSIGRVVQAGQHGQRNRHTHYPHKSNRQVDSIRVLMLRIF